MPNTNQDNTTVYIGKDGEKGPVTLDEFNSLDESVDKYMNNYKGKNALIYKQNSLNVQAPYIYLLFDMLMEGMSENFIGKTIFSDSLIHLFSINVLNSLAVIMGEEFAEQFIGKTFTNDDIVKAMTDKFISENADKVQTENEITVEEQERIKKLNDELVSARDKIKDNEKNIQIMQTEHENMISYLKQQITEIKDIYKEFKSYDDSHRAEITNKDIELHNAKIREAEAKKDSEINGLKAQIESNKQIYDNNCKNYQEKIEAKDNEIKELKKQLQNGGANKSNSENNTDNNDASNEKSGEQEAGKANTKAGKYLFEDTPLPKGNPNRKFSKRETKKRKELLDDALQFRTNDQVLMIADAYMRGLPYDALKRMYEWKDASKMNLKAFECGLLKVEFGLD